MKKSDRVDEINRWFLDICPQAVTSMRDLITDPSTPVASKVQLIGMVLDRALGKTETPLKVTTSQESMDEAEAQLMAMVHEFQIEDELKEAAEEENGKGSLDCARDDIEGAWDGAMDMEGNE